jgi:hypothetical protein
MAVVMSVSLADHHAQKAAVLGQSLKHVGQQRRSL